MKKILLLIIASLFVSTSLILTTYAKDVKCEPACTGQSICFEGSCQPADDLLLPRPRANISYDQISPELGAIGDLPSATSENIFKTAIKTMLGATMLLTIIALVVAGVYYIQSQGQEEDITKAKNIILYLLIGVVIMAAAYGLVGGIVQFDFFKAAP